MGVTPSPPSKPLEPRSSTNPLGGRVRSPRYDGPSQRHWSGYVAHVRICPDCGWENDEQALFCLSCASDVRSTTPVASSDTRPGVAVLQKRLERERRRHNRSRGEDSAGGGGWIAAGAALIGIAVVIGPDRPVSLVAWIAAVLVSLVGVWQIRRDHRAMRLWGGFLGGMAALVLMFVGFRAIQASGTFTGDSAPALIATPTDSIATPPAIIPSNTLSGSVTMSGGGPAHDSQMPGPAPDTAPVLAWQLDTGGELYGSPTIANGILYVTSKSGVLHAIDATTGEELWTHEVTSYVTRASPAVVDGTVYVGGGFSFSALDTVTGEVRWTVPMQYGGHASPTVLDGLVVVSSQQGWVFALATKTGEVAWRLPTEGIIFGAASITDNEVIYGTDEGILYSVDRRSGTLDWRVTLPGAIYATPVVSGDVILVSTQAGELHALDRTSGEHVWVANQGSGQPPATNGDIVVLAASDGGVYGLDLATGERLWLYPSGKQSLTAPAIAGNLVIVGTGNSLMALDISTGEAVWYFLAGDTIESAPIVVDGYVFFGGRDGFLNAVREDGTP